MVPLCAPDGVSIHAPLRREERLDAQHASDSSRRRFQSTPPSEERSDLGHRHHQIDGLGFQSTPPSEERSDALSLSHGWMGTHVSIHAPLRREERPRDGASSSQVGFNPRPPPKRGATSAPTAFRCVEVFQSTPPSEERSDPWSARIRGSGFGFQSTPPSEERSDLPAALGHREQVQFQSTPPSEERSDVVSKIRELLLSGFNPRPPPKRGATSDPPSERAECARFNPRPPPKRGATPPG